jgi:hypothetical protein
MSFLLPFDPPTLLTAERTAGFVDIPGFVQDDRTDRRWDNTTRSITETCMDDASTATLLSTNGLPIIACSPPPLERSQTMSGNIVVITSPATSNDDSATTTTDSTEFPCAFWLQRKLCKTHGGMIRLGYQLKQPSSSKQSLSSTKWELHTDALGRQSMVTIHVLPSSILDDTPSSPKYIATAANVYSPLNEFSALQRIARHHSSEPKHVVGTDLVATSSQHVYAVLPYHRDGTLLEFCQRPGQLPEPLARFFFRQIVKVREIRMKQNHLTRHSNC